MSTDTRPANPETKGALELTLAMVLSGTLGVFVIESGASPFNVVFFRCLFGTATLGLYCLARGFFKNHGFTPKKLGLAALGGVFIVFNWAFLFESYEDTSISVATVVYHTQPFYVMLLGAVLFRDKLTAAKFGWLGVAFVGLVLVAGVSAADLTGSGDSAYLAGLGYALLAAVFYGISTVITKRVTGVRPHLVALVQLVLGIFLLLPFTRLGEMKGLGGDWGWLVGLGVIHTCVMYVLMYSAYQKLPTPKIAVLAFVYPAVAMLMDWAVYGHGVSLLQALGIPLIVAASLGINLGWSFAGRRASVALRWRRDRTGADPVEGASSAGRCATAGQRRGSRVSVCTAPRASSSTPGSSTGDSPAHPTDEDQQQLRTAQFVTPYDVFSRDSNKELTVCEVHPILDNCHSLRCLDTCRATASATCSSSPTRKASREVLSGRP